MAKLVEPFEYLDLDDGQSVRLKVTRFEWGEGVIHPRYAGAPAEKVIPILRMYVVSGFKPTGAPYWDTSSKTLQGQLRPLESQIVKDGREFVVTAHGSGPAKRFTVRVE